MNNPIAKVSLYRLDGELRGTVLRTYEGAGLLPLGDHDVYAAPVTAANEQQNTQQPVAWVWQFPDGEYYEISHRDKEECERDCCGYDGMAVPLYPSQPEPGNQQMLAALKGLTEDIQYLIGESAGVYGLHLNGDLSPWVELESGGRFERLTHLPDAHAAIAAAEAAQPDHIVDTDKMVHAVPDVLEQLQLAETEVINAKAWSVGEEAKKHCKYALTAIAVARAQLSAAQKPEGV